MSQSKYLTAALLASSCLLTPSVSFAQDESVASGRQLDTIVVTATKREESVNDVGITINAVSADDIRELNLEDPQDLQLTVPGLVVSNSQGSNLPNFIIRGIGLNDFAPNNSSPVAVHLDEVNFTYSAFLNFGLFDISRAEVLKGPQGTTFGRNTTGGAVNFFTNRPTDEFAASFTGGLSNFQGYEFEGFINGPIAPGVSGRLSGFYKTQGSGPYSNDFLGRDDIGGIDDYWGLRGQLLLEASDTFEILLNVHGGVQDADSAQYDNLPALAVGGGLCAPFLDGTLRGGEAECVDVLGNSSADDDPFTSSAGLLNRQRLENIGANIRIYGDLGWADFVSITAIEKLDRFATEDADGFPEIIVDDIYINEIEQFSQEIRLASTGGGRFQWLLGAYYSNDNIDTPNQEFLGGDFPGIASGSNAVYTQETDSYAVFGNIEYDVTDRLTIIGGLRYTREERAFDGFTIITEPTTVIGELGVPFDPPIITASNTDDVTFTDVSWKGGVNFAATDDILLYANVSNGFKSGGFNGNLAFSDPVLEPFGEENLTAYEAGVKATLADNTVQVNAAGYYYDYSDIILQIGETLPGPGGVPFTVFRLNNGAEAEVYGFEGDITWLVFDGLELNAGAAYNSSEIKNAAPGNEALNGSELNYAPNFSGNFRVRYEQPITTSLLGHAQISGTYKGDHFGEVPNSPASAIDGYFLLGASVGVADVDGRWNLTVWGKNLTDEFYVQYLNDISALGYVLQTPGDVRTYGAKVTVNF